MTSVSIFNGMMLPVSYAIRKRNIGVSSIGVWQWDVAVERQVQLKGPDACRLAQILSARDLSNCEVGRGKYVPLCNHACTIVNDPMQLKLADDLFWFSIADSDIWFWARAIAAERDWMSKYRNPMSHLRQFRGRGLRMSSLRFSGTGSAVRSISGSKGRNSRAFPSP